MIDFEQQIGPRKTQRCQFLRKNVEVIITMHRLWAVSTNECWTHGFDGVMTIMINKHCLSWLEVERCVWGTVLTGSPTPRVTWRRVDEPLVEGADRVHTDSFGQELVFTNVDFADEGIYECMAVNTEREQPRATHKTQLVVECKPLIFSWSSTSLHTLECSVHSVFQF